MVRKNQEIILRATKTIDLNIKIMSASTPVISIQFNWMLITGAFYVTLRLNKRHPTFH